MKRPALVFVLVLDCVQTVLGESLRFYVNNGSSVRFDFESVRVRGGGSSNVTVIHGSVEPTFTVATSINESVRGSGSSARANPQERRKCA